MGVAIVTGGASGIGRALAAELLKRGDTVYLADVDADAVRATAEELGERAIPQTLDVTDADAVEALVETVEHEHGGLDLMVNNAGIAVGGAVEELTLDHWNRCIDVNLRGVVHGVHAAYPRMKARGHGQILNTASLAGLVPSPMSTPYSAAKHAVVGLSLSLRAEGERHGVRVSVLCPGVIDTPIFDRVNPDLKPTSMDDRAREVFTLIAKAMQGGKFYPPELLAADAVRGLERNDAVIVAPRGAKLTWLATRVVPSPLRELATRVTSQRWFGRFGL